MLIVNQTCVETGLDLNTFTTLIFYSMGYSLFTLRQASRRSWRINQTAPRVEVYLLYYADTVQAKAMKLMASKLAVAGIIEGSVTDEGLAAMSDVQDMTSQLAKELVLGIRDNVEDISAAFQRMAILHEHGERAASTPNDEVSTPSGEVSTPQNEASTRPSEMSTLPNEVSTPLPSKTEHHKHKPKKVDENQLTIFGFAA